MRAHDSRPQLRSWKANIDFEGSRPGLGVGETARACDLQSPHEGLVASLDSLSLGEVPRHPGEMTAVALGSNSYQLTGLHALERKQKRSGAPPAGLWARAPMPPSCAGNMDRHHYEMFTKFGDDGFLIHLDNARG